MSFVYIMKVPSYEISLFKIFVLYRIFLFCYIGGGGGGCARGSIVKKLWLFVNFFFVLVGGGGGGGSCTRVNLVKTVFTFN